MVVGITGGIGSGKSTVVKMFSEQKYISVYLADVEAKKIMNSSSEIRQKLIKQFTEEVYSEGILNRTFLAGIVFKDKKKLKVLNAIVHPVVHKHFREFTEEHADKLYILYENAILFENGSDVFCDKIITVVAPIETRVKRVMLRDNVTREDVMDRINNQWTDQKKIAMSNYVINNLFLDDTAFQVNEIHKKLETLYC